MSRGEGDQLPGSQRAESETEMMRELGMELMRDGVIGGQERRNESGEGEVPGGVDDEEEGDGGDRERSGQGSAEREQQEQGGHRGGEGREIEGGGAGS